MHALQQDLDAGEAEAIALALEASADVLLMDERIGRETANHMGLHCLRLIGLLIVARRRGIIDTVRPDLDALRQAAGFRIDTLLYQKVLREQGEF